MSAPLVVVVDETYITFVDESGEVAALVEGTQGPTGPEGPAGGGFTATAPLQLEADVLSLETSGVEAGTYGDGLDVPQVTVDALGRVTAADTVPISGAVAALNPGPTALADAATITWATAGARVLNASVTLGGNRTLAITGAVAGACGILAVTQDGTGSRTLTLPSGSKVANGGAGAVTLTSTAGATDILSVYYDGTTYWWTVVSNFT